MRDICYLLQVMNKSNEGITLRYETSLINNFLYSLLFCFTKFLKHIVNSLYSLFKNVAKSICHNHLYYISDAAPKHGCIWYMLRLHW